MSAPTVETPAIDGTRTQELADPRGILRGPILPTIVKIGAPVLALESLHVAYHLINLIWIGQLSAAASAAITTSLYATWCMTSLDEGIAIGILAQVARALGAGDKATAGRAAAQGTLLALVIGTLFAVFVRLLVGPLFHALGVPAEVAPIGVAYLTIIFAGGPALFLMGAGEAMFRATGDTWTPLKVVGISIVVNAILDPFLIFGIGPWPALGAAGAAMATVASWVLAVILFTILARRPDVEIPLDRRALLAPDPRAMLHTLRIGLPRFLIGSLFAGVYLGITNFVARLGTASLAVVGITNRLESLVYVSANSLGAATSTLVGQNLGARQPERAGRAVGTAAVLGIGVAILPMILMTAAPEACLRPFTRAPEVLALANPYVRIIGICQIFTVLELVFAAGFSGAGDTLPPMLVELPISAARVPLCWLLAGKLGLGLPGVAWVLTLTSIIRGTAMPLWFRTGRWQHKRL
jgi:putative MATE family efflux protein